MKRCTKCQKLKPLDQFHHRSKGSIDGRTSQCKTCKNRYTKTYFKESGYRKREIKNLSDNYIKSRITATLKIPSAQITSAQIINYRIKIQAQRDRISADNPVKKKARLINIRSKLKRKLIRSSNPGQIEQLKERLIQAEEEYQVLMNIPTDYKKRLIDKRSKLKTKICRSNNPLRLAEWKEELDIINEEYSCRYGAIKGA